MIEGYKFKGTDFEFERTGSLKQLSAIELAGSNCIYATLNYSLLLLLK